MSEARTARAEDTVFAPGPKRSWLVTAVIHGALFGALAVMARHPRARELARAASVVEFDAPPPQRTPPPPPEPPPPELPPPAAEPPRARAPRPAPAPAPAPTPPPNAAPPPIMTAQGNDAPSGDSVPTGNNTNFQGGATSTDGTGNRGGDGPPAPAPPPPAPEPVRRDGPVDLPDEATAPEPMDDNEQPDYPESLRQSGVQGTVIARFVVRADGSVSDVRILRGPEDLHDTVREALRRWRFQPATVNGHAIAVYRTMPFRFVLDNL